MSTISLLREATAPDHAAVDTVFGAIDLADREQYARFLRAHARALRPVEAFLASVPELPAWRTRLTLLEQDLAELGEASPEPLRFDPPPGEGSAWGVLYVVDGSRLGNIVLSRGVPEGWPARFVRARHRPGEWRALMRAIDSAGAQKGPAWRSDAVAGARACFDLYRRAA